MKLVSITLMGLVISAALSAPINIVTQRTNNYVRDGAGAYHKLLHVLPPKVELKLLEKKQNWYKVELPDKTVGWIAENSTKIIEGESDLKSNLAKTWSSPEASKSGIVAAIKGLQGKSKKTVAGDLDKLILLTENRITDGQMDQFKLPFKHIESDNKDEMDLSDLDLSESEYDPGLSEVHIGFGVASRLLEEGVLEQDSLDLYVNLMMNYLVAESEFYDWQFNLIILNSSSADGYSCPGGFIFMTKGAILSCNDEAELASLIAHEMAHVIQRHGLQEMFKRESHIKMDAAFEELDKATGEETDAEIQELEDMMITSYNKIVRERLLKYELEADQIAAVICANASYDPFALVRITERLSQLYEKTDDIFDDNYLAPNEMQSRASAIHEFIDDKFTRENPGVKLKERFILYKDKIR